jgi:hypothetical protein
LIPEWEVYKFPPQASLPAHFLGSATRKYWQKTGRGRGKVLGGSRKLQVKSLYSLFDKIRDKGKIVSAW